MKGLRLTLAPEHLCVRLVTVLLLGITFLPSTSCDMRSSHYFSHEIVIPKSLTAKGSKGPGEKVSYMLLLQGQKHVINLKVKRDYFVNNFPVYSYHNGSLGQEKPFIAHDCHYEGYIEGVPGSFVSINTCAGLRGILMKKETSFGIEPMLSSERFEHVLHTLAHQARVSCSVTSANSQGDPSQQQRSRKPHRVQSSPFLWYHTKYVEMFVVVNHQRFQMWGSNVSETVQAVVHIIALANSFTRGINTEVVLAGMEIWTEGDLIEVSVDLQVTLRNFNRWRREKLLPRVRHDVAHMIVGHHPGESMGQAFLNGACSSGFAAAVESFPHEDVLLFAALMVHELGHNLGIQHDRSACTCKDEHSCLMHGNITKQSGFSNCSSDYFYHFLREHRGACLFNKPWRQSRQRRSGTCGNGVVESPEQCDCGTACADNRCCDQNCYLKGDAQCNDEPCCSECKLKGIGEICRYAYETCDLPEYCNGVSAACPENRIMLDGSICNQFYYCLRGQCLDPGIQCTQIFGVGSRSAPGDCYHSLNAKGNRFGNCGSVTQNQVARYITCSPENALCGKVVCTEVSFLPPIQNMHTLIQVPHEKDYCWSMDFFDVHDVPDEGLVMNGTYCASGKVCISFQCASLPQVQSSCTANVTCNGNGICNDLEHCHCYPGFAPPDCIEKGFGGSVDSGPPTMWPNNEKSTQSYDYGKEDLILNMKLLVVTIILGITAIGICIACYKIAKQPTAEELSPETTILSEEASEGSEPASEETEA